MPFYRRNEARFLTHFWRLASPYGRGERGRIFWYCPRTLLFTWFVSEGLRDFRETGSLPVGFSRMESRFRAVRNLATLTGFESSIHTFQQDYFSAVSAVVSYTYRIAREIGLSAKIGRKGRHRCRAVSCRCQEDYLSKNGESRSSKSGERMPPSMRMAGKFMAL